MSLSLGTTFYFIWFIFFPLSTLIHQKNQNFGVWVVIEKYVNVDEIVE